MTLPDRNDTTYVAARGAVPSPWIMALPPMLRAPIIYFYVDIIAPDDDFLTQLRKLVMTVCCFISSVSVLMSIYNWLTIPVADTSAGTIVARLVSFIFIVVWVGAYLLMRFTRLTSDAVALFFICGTWTNIFLIDISFIDWPTTDSMILLAAVVQLTRVRFAPLMLFMCFAAFVISANNQAAYARGPPDVPLWALPGAVMRGYPTRMLLAMSSLSTAFLVLSALQLQLMESDKLTRQAQASSELALQIARLLGEYRTDGAAELIEEAQRDESADPKLLEALGTLVDNLNRYRPHLPNWMLPREGSDEEGCARDADVTTVRESRSSRRPHAADDTRSTSSVRSSARRGAKPQADSVEQQWFRGGEPFESLVTIAEVQFRGVGGEDASRFVDLVHRLAGQTSAALHTFLGDAVVATWNAASRAIQGEVKAARWLARVAAQGGEWAEVSGGAVTGKAQVQLAGGGASEASGRHQQRALLLSAPELFERMSHARTHGTERGCLVVDYATRNGASHAAHFVASGATVLSGRRLALYALSEEAKDDDTDEWMYVLKQREAAMHGGEGPGRLTAALDLWARGEDDKIRGELGMFVGSASITADLQLALSSNAA